MGVRTREPHRLVDGGVRRHTREQQLVGAQPQHVEDLGVHAGEPPMNARSQRVIEPRTPTEHAITQLAREASILRPQCALRGHLVERLLREAVTPRDARQRFERGEARRVTLAPLRRLGW